MQKNYGLKFDISRPGFRIGMGTPRVRALTNSAKSLTDTWTLAVPAVPAASTTYSVTANNKTATVVTAAVAPTQAALRDLLIDAIQQSEVFDVFAATSVAPALITMVARRLDAAVVTTAVGLVLTNTVPFAKSNPIGFGLFVARAATDAANVARLPSTGADKLVGVTYATYFAERDAIGSDAKTAYKPDEVMDVLDRVNDCEAIWVQCVEDDLTAADTLYVVASTNPDLAGRVTRSAAGNIALNPNFYSFVSDGTVVNSDLSRMIALSLNLP
jgi:hypothetical protein